MDRQGIDPDDLVQEAHPRARGWTGRSLTDSTAPDGSPARTWMDRSAADRIQEGPGLTRAHVDGPATSTTEARADR